jgi:hypothetical protein
MIAAEYPPNLAVATGQILTIPAPAAAADQS